MSNETDKIVSLKLILENATKIKLSKEREVLKLRNKERSLSDELNTLKSEINYMTDQLEMLKKQLTQSKHQISLIEICMTSEDVKIEAHTDTLKEHLEGYKQLFENEMEARIKEQKDLEVEQLEQVRKKETLLAEENERQTREASAIDEECEVIEKECVVLKKRNNAILLKLRKKLLETENLRRVRMKNNC